MQTILLIEDYSNAQQALFRFLHHKGFHVITALTLSQAGEFLRTMPVDLILCDMEALPLPNQLLEEARRKHYIPAIAYSGWYTQEDHDRAQLQGFEAFFAKPLDLQKISDAISTLLLPTEPEQLLPV